MYHLVMTNIAMEAMAVCLLKIVIFHGYVSHNQMVKFTPKKNNVHGKINYQKNSKFRRKSDKKSCGMSVEPSDPSSHRAVWSWAAALTTPTRGAAAACVLQH